MKNNIYLVTSHLYSGGTASITESYYKMYKNKGYIVKCIVLDSSKFSGRFDIDQRDLVFFDLNLKRNSGLSNFKRVVSILSNLRRFRLWCAKNDGVYKFIHFEPVLLGLLSLFGLDNIYKINTIHTNIFQYRIGLKGIKRIGFDFFLWLMKSKDPIVFLTDDVADNYRNLYRSTSSKVYSIPNIVNVDVCESIKSDKRDVGIVYCGRLSKEKNAHLIIPIFDEYRKSGGLLNCTIIGDGPEKDNILEQYNESRYSKYINIQGHVDNVNTYYDSANFLIMLSKTEGFGLVIVEAISRCLPVIASNCYSGPSSILAHKLNVEFDTTVETNAGILLPILNDDSISISIYAETFLNFENREKISVDIAKDIVQRYSEDVLFNYWVKVINGK
ncbi:glycosyltransferase [Vibrio splendidus]